MVDIYVVSGLVAQVVLQGLGLHNFRLPKSTQRFINDFLQQQTILEQTPRIRQADKLHQRGTCAGLAEVVVLTIKLQSAGGESGGIVQRPSCNGGCSRKHESAERPPAIARIGIAYTYLYISGSLLSLGESITVIV